MPINNANNYFDKCVLILTIGSCPVMDLIEVVYSDVLFSLFTDEINHCIHLTKWYPILFYFIVYDEFTD
jgi:hypothetical protein